MAANKAQRPVKAPRTLKNWCWRLFLRVSRRPFY